MTETVLTIGTFDPVHVDHVALFRRAERFGLLVVGVNSDRFVGFYRGRAAMFSENERRAQVSALGYATELNDGPGIDLVREVSPNYLVIGNDWLEGDYLAQIAATPADLRDIALVFLPRGRTISSTEIRERAG